MAGKSKKSGLGKGLETLIPVGEMEEIDNLIVKEKKTEKNSGDTVLKISQIEPNKSQPRKNFNEDSLQELAAGIPDCNMAVPDNHPYYNHNHHYQILEYLHQR